MTAPALLLEDFGTDTPATALSGPARDPSPGPDALEEARLAGFEAGFRAGWDDATAALGEADDGARAAALAKLQEMSFGFHEARSQLLGRLGPMLEALLARILPEIARETLGPAILEALTAPLHAAAAEPPALHLHPDGRRAVEAFLAGAGAPPLRLVADPALGAGEALLLPADPAGEAVAIEGEVMIETMLARLRDALASLHAPPEPTRAAHG